MSAASLKILIVGGYGTFGGRLAQLLSDEPRLTLLIAGRSLAKATAFCDALPAGAARHPVAFDRDGDLEAQLAASAPDIVVDASGPFQAYGADPYRLVRAAIAKGIDYLDLADGSDFVAGVSSFDAEARDRGVAVLSGVSSFPVLTAAVVRALAEGWRQVETITAGIAPSPYAGVGPNVIAAISNYAGQPVQLRREGVDATGYALTETMRYTVRPPGRLPLRNLRFSLVDVPDLRLLPPLWPGLRSIWIGVAPVPESLHIGLNGMAWLVRRHILPNLSPFAPLFHAVINILRWGEHRGGMFIALEGIDASSQPVRRSWHMLAEGDHGPLIPSMAVEALMRKHLSGERQAPGARPATNSLELTDYDALFTRRAIRHGIREDSAVNNGQPLYRRVLADAWPLLPEPVRSMHESGTLEAAGTAEVTRGTSLLSRLVARLFGFPKEGANIPVSLRFDKTASREIWTRTFGESPFSSEQYEGVGRNEGLICERFGPLVFAMALVLEEGKLHLIVRRWSAFGIPMPAFLAPTGEAYEKAEDGRFRFHVEIGLPLIGLIVRYRGWLEVDAEKEAARILPLEKLPQ